MKVCVFSGAISALCASVCAPVWAQSSGVTLGGQVKLGLNTISMGPGTATSRLNDGTSFFYFDGKESLDDGLQAFYHLEWGFNADTGTQSTPRNIYVGMGSDRLGRLQLGRQSVYFSHHWFINDVHGSFDAAPQAANSLNMIGSINGAHFAGNFMNNTIRYQSPVWNGFGGIVSYSTDAEEPGASRNRTWYVAPAYTRGAFKGAWFHLQRDNQGALPAQTVGTLDQTADRLALGYTWNQLGFGLLWDRNRVSDQATGVTQSRNAFAIPLSYQAKPYMVSLTYGQAQAMRSGGSTVGDTGARMLSLSGQYDFSRRTSVAASMVEVRNQAQGRYNFWTGGLQPGPQLAQADAGARIRMFYVGLKHQF